MDDSLEPIFTKYPKLRANSKALDEYEAGQPITATCIVCGEVLTVHRIDIEGMETVITWVSCAKGCTVYRQWGTKTQLE